MTGCVMQHSVTLCLALIMIATSSLPILLLLPFLPPYPPPPPPPPSLSPSSSSAFFPALMYSDNNSGAAFQHSLSVFNVVDGRATNTFQSPSANPTPFFINLFPSN